MKKLNAVILGILISMMITGPVPVFSATTGVQIEFLLSQVRNSSGSLAGGKVYFYSAGTTTAKDVYADINKVAVAANPYTLDANGTALLYGDGTYRVVIKTAAGVTVYDRDSLKFEDLATGLINSEYMMDIKPKSLTGNDTGNITGYDNITATSRIRAPSIGSASYTDNGNFRDIYLGGRTTNALTQGVIWKLNTYEGAVAYGGFPGKNTFMHDFSYGNNGTVEPIGNNTFLGMDAGNLHMGSTATATWESSYNTGLGVDCLFYNTTGAMNTGVGALAVSGNYAGHYNTGVGALAMLSNNDGDGNTALGFNALRMNVNGSFNIAIGHDAGRYAGSITDNNVSSEESIFIGYAAKPLVTSGSNEIVIGSQATGMGSYTTVIGNDNTTDTYIRGKLHAVGTATNDNATSGGFGEYIDNTVTNAARLSLSTASAKTIASVTLSPGDWDVTGMVKFGMGNTTNVTRLIGGTSFVDNNWENNDMTNSQRFFPTAGQVYADNVTGWDSEGIVVPTRRVSVSATTTVYLYAYAVFTVSTVDGYGFIRARRMR